MEHNSQTVVSEQSETNWYIQYPNCTTVLNKQWVKEGEGRIKKKEKSFPQEAQN